MSDTTSTAVTAQWSLDNDNTSLGASHAHHWVFTNDYQAPVFLQVPPSIFTEANPPSGYFKIAAGGNKTLDLLAKQQRATGNFAYTVSTPGNGPQPLTGNLHVDP
jgi:hypothetical protein